MPEKVERVCAHCNDRLALKGSELCKTCQHAWLRTLDSARVGACSHCGGPFLLKGENTLCTECRFSPKVERTCRECKAKFFSSGDKFVRCGTCRRKKSKNMRAQYRDKYRQRRIDKTFSYAPGEFAAKLTAQNNKCDNCGVEFSDLDSVENMLTARVPVPYNDHDHQCCNHRATVTHPTCGKCNRGLVCLRCNVLLGYAEDSIEVLEQTIAYLRRWREQHAVAESAAS
jgi:hypothetical protein